MKFKIEATPSGGFYLLAKSYGLGIPLWIRISYWGPVEGEEPDDEGPYTVDDAKVIFGSFMRYALIDAELEQ